MGSRRHIGILARQGNLLWSNIPCKQCDKHDIIIKIRNISVSVTMSESEVKAGIEESLPDAEKTKAGNGVKEHSAKEVIQNGETDSIISNGDIEMKELGENKEQNGSLDSDSIKETEKMEVDEESSEPKKEDDLVNGSEIEEKEKEKDKDSRQNSSDDSIKNNSSVISDSNESQLNKEQAETDSDKN